MAMRPTGRGAMGPRRQENPFGRQGVGVVQPVFVDFKPISEWKQEKEADTLLVYLPGFLKQNLKVSTEGQNMVRARGERLDAGNRWSRFQEDFQVPERCDIRAIRARYERGVLTITMPWTADWIQHQSQIHDTAQPNASSQDLTTPVPGTQSPPKQISPQEPKKETVLAPMPEKETTHTPQMTKKETMPTQMPEKIPAHQDRKNPVIIGERERLSVKPQVTKINDDDAEMKKGESVQNIVKALEASKERQHSPTLNDRKKKDIVNKESLKDEKLNKEIGSVATTSTGIGNHNYKEAVKNLVELKEERQLLVNVGAAVLVIVALGTYIVTSRLGSGDDN